MRNKFLEELLETVQDLIKRLVRCIHKLSGPEPEPTLLEKIINFCWSLYLSLFQTTEVRKRRLFSDVFKKLSKCE